MMGFSGGGDQCRWLGTLKSISRRGWRPIKKKRYLRGGWYFTTRHWGRDLRKELEKLYAELRGETAPERNGLGKGDIEARWRSTSGRGAGAAQNPLATRKKTGK